MQSNISGSESEAASPLLVVESSHEGEEEAKERRWNKKILDVGEAKNQILFSLPMILTNVSYYLIPLVSVMFAGHLGELELAAANLANSWASVTGLAFMVLLFSLSLRNSIIFYCKFCYCHFGIRFSILLLVDWIF